MEKRKPIRMCIACRDRVPQGKLLRLQQNNNDIVFYSGMGRSFYVCMTCGQDEKKVKGLAKRFKQDVMVFKTLLETQIGLKGEYS